MEDPEREIKTVLARLYSTNRDAIQAEVERVFMPDASLSTPLLVFTGRDNITRILGLYGNMVSTFESLTFHDVKLSSKRPRLYVDWSYSFKWLLFANSENTMKRTMLIDLTLAEEKGGKRLWRIKHQQDFVDPADALIGLLPPPFGSLARMLLVALQVFSATVSLYVWSPLVATVCVLLSPLAFLFRRKRALEQPDADQPLRDVERDMFSFLQHLLSTDSENVGRLVDRSFSSDAEFTHPLAYFRGRDEIKTLYVLWSRVNRFFKNHTVADVCFNPSTQRCYMDMSYMPAPYFALVPTEVRIVSVLDLKPTHGGDQPSDLSWLITKQHDFIQPHILLKALIAGYAGFLASSMLRLVEQALGLGIVYIIAPFMSLLGDLIMPMHHKEGAKKNKDGAIGQQ